MGEQVTYHSVDPSQLCCSPITTRRRAAGRANFITGELPIRTSMTTVGQAGAAIGILAQCNGAALRGS